MKTQVIKNSNPKSAESIWLDITKIDHMTTHDSAERHPLYFLKRLLKTVLASTPAKFKEFISACHEAGKCRTLYNFTRQIIKARELIKRECKINVLIN